MSGVIENGTYFISSSVSIARTRMCRTATAIARGGNLRCLMAAPTVCSITLFAFYHPLLVQFIRRECHARGYRFRRLCGLPGKRQYGGTQNERQQALVEDVCPSNDVIATCRTFPRNSSAHGVGGAAPLK